MISILQKRLIAYFSSTMAVFSATGCTDYGAPNVYPDKDYCEGYAKIIEQCCNEDTSNDEACHAFNNLCCDYKDEIAQK